MDLMSGTKELPGEDAPEIGIAAAPSAQNAGANLDAFQRRFVNLPHGA